MDDLGSLYWSPIVQVGRRIFVQIMRIDESKNDLILSERQAWVGSRSVLFSIPFIFAGVYL